MLYRTFSRRGVLLASTALLVASTSMIGSASAQVTIKVPAAKLHVMPAGSHPGTLTAADRKVRAEGARLLISDAEARAQLEAKAQERIKSGATGAPGTLIAPAVRSQTIAGSTCTTNAATGFAPSDIHGAVSDVNIVVVTNVDIGIFDKTTCAQISFQSLKAFFGEANPNVTLFDPRVIYDKVSRRFFVTVESRDSTNTNQNQYFAVSTNSAGTAYHNYGAAIQLSNGASFFCKQAANSFWDYPNVGVNRYRWFITANDFGTSVPSSLLNINKAPTFTGAPTQITCFPNIGGGQANFAPPVVLDGSTKAIFLSPGSGAGSAVARRDLTTSSNPNPATDTLAAPPSFPITAWTSSPGGRQPNTGNQRLDGLDGRFQSASIQSRGFLWNVHAINVGGFSRVRMYRFDARSATASPAPTVVFTPITSTGEDLINPSVATGSGLAGAPAFITATRTIATDAVNGKATTIIFSGMNSLALASVWKFDIVAQSTSTYDTTNGVTSCNASARGSCRWGDYSSTQVDPLASGRGWGWNQNIPGTGTNQFNWDTKAGRVDVNLPAAPDQQ